MITIKPDYELVASERSIHVEWFNQVNLIKTIEFQKSLMNLRVLKIHNLNNLIKRIINLINLRYILLL